MSMDMMATERVCYVHCNFCNTTLACQAKSDAHREHGKHIVRVLTFKLAVSGPDLAAKICIEYAETLFLAGQ